MTARRQFEDSFEVQKKCRRPPSKKLLDEDDGLSTKSQNKKAVKMGNKHSLCTCKMQGGNKCKVC